MPAVLGLGTPWADLTETGDTMFTNEDIDQVLVHYNGVLGAAARLYAGDHDLADPLLSPVNGDFAGFPPTILIAGTRDMLLSATVRVHRKLRAAGIDAQLHVFEGMSHGFYLALPDAPESRETFTEIAQFFRLPASGTNGLKYHDLVSCGDVVACRPLPGSRCSCSGNSPLDLQMSCRHLAPAALPVRNRLAGPIPGTTLGARRFPAKMPGFRPRGVDSIRERRPRGAGFALVLLLAPVRASAARPIPHLSCPQYCVEGVL